MAKDAAYWRAYRARRRGAGIPVGRTRNLVRHPHPQPVAAGVRRATTKPHPHPQPAPATTPQPVDLRFTRVGARPPPTSPTPARPSVLIDPLNPRAREAFNRIGERIATLPESPVTPPKLRREASEDEPAEPPRAEPPKRVFEAPSDEWEEVGEAIGEYEAEMVGDFEADSK